MANAGYGPPGSFLLGHLIPPPYSAAWAAPAIQAAEQAGDHGEGHALRQDDDGAGQGGGYVGAQGLPIDPRYPIQERQGPSGGEQP